MGAALVHFTGSMDHDVAIRTRAVRERLRVNEWGVFSAPEGSDPESLGPTGERAWRMRARKSVYDVLGLERRESLDPKRARAQWKEIEGVRERVPEINILRSAEVVILKDGTLDLPDDILDGLDLVVISVR